MIIPMLMRELRMYKRVWAAFLVVCVWRGMYAQPAIEAVSGLYARRR